MASKDLTPAPGEIAALLGRGTKFRGKLVFEGRVRIDGHFEGEVHTEGVLVVGESAELEGTFDVGSLLALGGTVRGKVRARELVELHADSHVLADLETPRLFVDKGARFDGACRMSDGAPSERLPMDEATSPLGQASIDRGAPTESPEGGSREATPEDSVSPLESTSDHEASSAASSEPSSESSSSSGSDATEASVDEARSSERDG